MDIVVFLAAFTQVAKVHGWRQRVVKKPPSFDSLFVTFVVATKNGIIVSFLLTLSGHTRQLIDNFSIHTLSHSFF